MYLHSCAVVVLVCLTLTEQAASQQQFPRWEEWESNNPFAWISQHLFNRRADEPLPQTSWPADETYPPINLQAKETYPPINLQAKETYPPIKILEPAEATPTPPRCDVTNSDPRTYHTRPSNTGVCESMICPAGTLCHPTSYQCPSPPCPTVAECTDYGSGDVSGMCDLPVAPGNCSQSYQSWYWNSQTRRCDRFSYSGCHGNGNRFNNLASCQRMCDRREQLCKLAPETGMCRAAKPRYFYNATVGCCQEFIYGGCRGNSNNFHSQAECADFCSGVTL